MNQNLLYEPLKKLVQDELEKQFAAITPDRVALLNQVTQYVQHGVNQSTPINLTFICTHNSRRSHLAQIWAQTAAFVYGLKNLSCYSGGTEATAFNPRAVRAMRDAGFNIKIEKEGNNPVYEVRYSDKAPALSVFSKTYDDTVNPEKSFAAVMTCSHADENCPFIPGADTRIALTYDDPKDFDGTDQEETKYAERVREIGRDLLYAMARVKAG